MAWLLILAGLVLLAVGGDILVRGAVGTAERLNVSPLITGLVLVGFGTSMPELVTSLKAALSGAPGIAVGNVVGSNIANILLILGFAAVITPIKTDPQAFKRDAPMLAIATAACVLFALSGSFGRLTGAVFLAMLFGYIGFTYLRERKTSDAQARLHVEETKLVERRPHKLWLSLALTVGGIAAVVAGANGMVSGSVIVARNLGISETVIGLTIVAIGTSLPELAASIAAARRGEVELIFGNILGSNQFNILGILGTTAVVHPIAVPSNVLVYDLWFMAAVTALFIWFALTDARMSRREGGIFLALYALFIAFLGVRSLGLV